MIMIMMDPTPLYRSATDTNSKSITRSLRNGSVGTFLFIVLAILSVGREYCHHQHEHVPLRSAEQMDFGLEDSSSSIMTVRKPQPQQLAVASVSGMHSAVTTSLVAVATGSSLDMLALALKPVLLELGVVVVLQSIGLPMVSTLGLLARRIRWASIGRGMGVTVSATAVKHFKVSVLAAGKVWKHISVTYTRTSASKVVGRSKSIIKSIIHRHDRDNDDDNSHEKSVESH
jgi:hypothetical protein